MTEHRSNFPTVTVVRSPRSTTEDEWFACCSDRWPWPNTDPNASCNFYGAYRTTKREAENDAARHRRGHKDRVRASWPNAHAELTREDQGARDCPA